jgi:CPA2 family monovalent cation:H+ antiporter-2
MHALTFLEDLAVVMIVAGLVTIACHRLRQPVVLGYMIAGIIIGPHTPPFPLITDQEAIDTLAELGIIFLMFSLGLEFNLRKLRRVGATALVAGVLEIVIMLWVGYEAGRFFGWREIDSIFLGAMISISSTTIIVKALVELDRMKEESSQLIFGILIVEDVLGIAMIALLTGLARTGAVDAGEVLLTVGRLALFVAALLVIGLLTVPRILGYVGRFRRKEVLLIVVLGICFGVSLLSAKLGYSVALGAFAIGAVMAESREIERVQALTEPIRDMFSAVFFVATGLLIDPRMIVDHAGPIAVICLAVVLGKVLTCSAGTLLTGHDARTSLRVGMGLAQIGEFSFIIAALGGALKVTSDFLYPAAVCVSAITTFLTPYFIRGSDPLAAALTRRAPPALLDYIDVYVRRVRGAGQAEKSPAIARQARGLTWRLLIEVILIAAVFVSARLLGSRRPARFDLLPEWLGGASTVLWLAAVLLSLPIIVLAVRTLRALGDLLGGASGGPPDVGARAMDVGAIVSHTVVIAGSAGLAALVVVLSSAILPPWQVLIVLALVLASSAAVLWRPLARLYEKAERALHGALGEAAGREGSWLRLPEALGDEGVDVVELTGAAAAVGRRIRELKIRTRTGASVVAIERDGRRVINPSPEEMLRAGDRLFLLGEESQRQAARALLTRTDPSGPGASPAHDPR